MTTHRPEPSTPIEEDPAGAWPLEPSASAEGLKSIAGLFGTGLVGGAITMAFLLPHTIEARGAGMSLAVDRARRARCLELGITPEELARRERSGLEAAAGDDAEPGVQERGTSRR